MTERDTDTAYIIGMALGDGNLSNPNGRAVRLRITCDNKYPNIIKRVCSSLQKVFPNNSVSVVKRKENCVDVSCYSNKLPNLLGWSPEEGPKYRQNIRIPSWIFEDISFIKSCIKGLFESDGCVYRDRGYLMANFVTIIESLSKDVMSLLKILNIEANIYKIKERNSIRFNIRISKDTASFIDYVNIDKS